MERFNHASSPTWSAYRTDPITCPVDQLLGLRPVFTMVRGRAVYDPETFFGQGCLA